MQGFEIVSMFVLSLFIYKYSSIPHPVEKVEKLTNNSTYNDLIYNDCYRNVFKTLHM